MLPSYTLLYVDNARVSAVFYQALLDLEPVELSDTFALFVLPGGFKLGMWGRADVQPAPRALAGATELCFSLPETALVDQHYSDWRARGVTIAQTPCNMDFGRTFVGLDPDGHRLRVLALTL